MVSNQWVRFDGARTVRVWAGLFVVLLTWTGVWSQGPGRLAVTVQQGQLSVDAQGATVEALLAQIEAQGHIRIFIDPSAEPQMPHEIRTQFAGMALEDGLRRLFRVVSLDHTIFYTQGLGGPVVMTDVHVFGQAQGRAPAPQEPSPARLNPRAAVDLGQDPPTEGEPQDPSPAHLVHGRQATPSPSVPK
jgi:hypothetical protein